MTRKLIALLMVISLVFCLFSGCSSKQQEIMTNTTIQVDGYDISVKENNTKREATTTVEGVELICEHIFDTQECLMYINEEPIELGVNVLNDRIEVFMIDEKTSLDYQEKIVGQFALTATLATPAFISAAKALICTALGVTLTASICVSADAIGNVASGVRYNARTYSRYRTIDISAADAIRYGRIRRSNTYYEAYLSGNAVFIGKEITQYQAIWRLESGRDVFATSAFAAAYACIRASTNKNRGKQPTHHTGIKSEGYYPHYHPLGRRWINNRNSAPHCWYPS